MTPGSGVWSTARSSFYATYLGWFGDLVGARYAPIVFLAIGGLLAVVGAALGPETRHIDLSATGNSDEQRPTLRCCRPELLPRELFELGGDIDLGQVGRTDRDGHEACYTDAGLGDSANRSCIERWKIARRANQTRIKMPAGRRNESGSTSPTKE